MTTRGKECKHDGARRGGGPSIEGWLWCTGCRAEIRRDDDGVWRQKPDDADAEPTCTCVEIMQADETRHFRGCPLREKYPEHPAAQCGDLLQLDSQHVCNKPKGHDGMHSSGAKSWGPTQKSVESRKQPFIIELEEHRRAMETDDGGYRGQNANVEVRRVRDAVRFLLVEIERLEDLPRRIIQGELRAPPLSDAEIKRIVRAAVPFLPDEPTAAERADARDEVQPTNVRRNARPVRRIIEQDAPTIVALCGSTRFKKSFNSAMLAETLVGKIVLSVGGFDHADDLKLTDETKVMLDVLHKKKIEMADEVFVLNAFRCKTCGAAKEYTGNWQCKRTEEDYRGNGCVFETYIGESTKSEIRHARKLKKRIRFLNPQGDHRCSELSANDTSGMTVEQTMQMLGLA